KLNTSMLLAFFRAKIPKPTIMGIFNAKTMLLASSCFPSMLTFISFFSSFCFLIMLSSASVLFLISIFVTCSNFDILALLLFWILRLLEYKCQTFWELLFFLLTLFEIMPAPVTYSCTGRSSRCSRIDFSFIIQTAAKF
ncbi:hypothetical protein L9F63_000597, partial [Diploptera punctata]